MRAVWVVTRRGRVVATITIDHLADADFWRKTDRVRSALYVHRMAVARRESGIGLGAAMLDWAAERVVRAGRSRLRLDAWATNTGLHQYYEKLGFVRVRFETVPGRGSGALFERPATDRQGLGPELVPYVARPLVPPTTVVPHDDEGLRVGGDLVPA